MTTFLRHAIQMLGGAALLTAVTVLLATRASAQAQDWNSSLATWSIAGKGEPILNGYQEVTIAEHQGAGCLTHMWFGGEWANYQKTRIRVYVDGEVRPSIDMELGMGMGVGFDDHDPFSSERIGKTGNDSGIYNTTRIPYGKSIRVTAQRWSGSPDGDAFWWIVRGTDGLRVVLGDVRLPLKARLKLYTVNGYTAQPLEEVTMCDVHGPGAVYEVAIAAHGLKDTGGWFADSYMEGCIRAYFNGSADPELLSSGYEDYFMGTYYFQNGKYANSLAGVTHLDKGAGHSVSAYRFHDEDPLFFQHGLRLTCRDGDTEHGTKTGNMVGNPPPAEFTTYVWVYQW